ncbi:MAG TPA: ProQ/FINO family protein [Burkholderiales bacterium]
MKTLTPAERARRAAALGITLPASASRGATTSQCRPGPGGRAIAAQPVEPAPPPPKPAAGPRKLTGASYERFTRVRGLLQARYPQIFSWGRPLAIGIDLKLREAFTEEELPTADLKVFLRTWVHRKAYRVALARGDHRINLDGSDAGPAFGDIQAGEAAEGDERT